MKIENLLYDFYTSDVPDEISNELLVINNLSYATNLYIFSEKQIIMKHIKAYLQNIDLEKEFNNDNRN